MCNMVEFGDFHHCYVSMFFMVFAFNFFLQLPTYKLGVREKNDRANWSSILFFSPTPSYQSNV